MNHLSGPHYLLLTSHTRSTLSEQRDQVSLMLRSEPPFFRSLCGSFPPSSDKKNYTGPQWSKWSASPEHRERIQQVVGWTELLPFHVWSEPQGLFMLSSAFCNLENKIKHSWLTLEFLILGCGFIPFLFLHPNFLSLPGNRKLPLE